MKSPGEKGGKWTAYRSFVSDLSKEHSIAVDKVCDCAQIALDEDVRSSAPECFSMVAEINWIKIGRPSYRVATPLANALVKTNLDIDSSFVRFPHGVFSVEFQEGHKIGDLKSLLVFAASAETVATEPGGRRYSRADSIRQSKPVPPDGKSHWVLSVSADVGKPDYDHHPISISLNPGEKLSDRLDLLDTTEEMKGFVKLALGVAMFSVSANAGMVKRIGPRKKTGKRSKKSRLREASAKRLWSLGADILLPGSGSGDSVRSGGDGEGSRELSFAHIRQGHLRMQALGSVDSRHYELRYIAPTVVRPDLPLSPAATRHKIMEKAT